MLGNHESWKEVIRPDFNRAIMIDLQGANITSDSMSPFNTNCQIPGGHYWIRLIF